MGTPPPIELANVSMGDTLVLMVLALVVFGPRRLPQIGRQIGKLMYEFRKASNDFKFQMEEELRQAEEADRRKKEEAEREKALAANPPAPQLDVAAPQLEAPAEPVTESASATPENTSDSSNPSESTGPGVIIDPTRPEETVEDTTASAVEAARFRIEPRIQPPSTGEVVAADPPNAAPQQAELFESPSEPAAQVAVNENTSGANKAANDAPNDVHRSEPAAHHG